MHCHSIKRVTGRKARGRQGAGGNKLQVADFFFPSLHKIKDTCVCLELTNAFFLCQWNYEFPLKFAFLRNGSAQGSLFSFLKHWADNGLTDRYSCQLFLGGGWHTLCHHISKVHIVGEGSGETPSALGCLSYLMNSFLTDTKHLAINQQESTLFVPFWCLCQKLYLSLLYFNKTLLHKSSK